MTSLSELLDYSINNVKSVEPKWRDSKDTMLRVDVQSAKDELERAIKARDMRAATDAKAQLVKAEAALKDYIGQVVDLQVQFLDFANEYDIDVNYCMDNASEQGNGYTDADAEFWVNAMNIAQSLVKHPEEVAQ